MTNYSMLYNGNAEINSQMLNSIIQAAITFVDDIWINSNTTLSKNMSTPVRENAHDIMKLLEDKHIIKRWSLPNLEINTDDYEHKKIIIDTTSKSMIIDTTKQSQKINTIPFDKYEEINNKINEIFLTNKNLLATISHTYQPIGNQKKEIETTSKVISIRKEYWSVAIASILGANRLLIAPEYKNMWLNTSEKLRYPLIEEKLARYILENFCSVPDMTMLKPEDILKLHNKNKSFRKKICKISEDIFTEFQYISDIEPLGQEIQDSIWEYVDETIGDRKSSFIKNVGYTISGIYYPEVAALPFVDEFITWLSTQRKYGYILYLSELKRISRQSMRKR